MGKKSERKKQYIRETARKVFIEKGYKNVTMKDVVEACQISRGGLYLYYASTQELFLDVLKMESEDTGDTFSEAISNNASPADILGLFLEEQKKELLRKEDTLVVATYEYAFDQEKPENDTYLRNQFQEAVTIIERLIMLGVRSGEFVCRDPHAAAKHMMYAIEGLKISAKTMGITEQTVDEEMNYLMSFLVGDDEE
ncbi:MAG: TetR/AcrR family transcriptional regulator [Lachnospiraceae bacterium]|nr:TetR/AcrR family transcriptional regulator [Lachnospiraceae bacterium]